VTDAAAPRRTNTLAKLHWIVGFTFAAVFIATGQWMRASFPEAFRGDAGMRMMFRSAHVYILLAALPNLLLGASMRRSAVTGGVARTAQAREPAPDRPAARRTLERIGSACWLAAPIVFTTAFAIEPAPERLDRPITILGVALAAMGTATWCIGSALAPRRRSGPECRSGPE